MGKADEFRDHLVVKYNLIKWIQKIKSIQRANVLYIQAAKYHNTKIIRNSFNQWNFETKKLQNLNQKLEIFKEKRLFITMKINIRNWRNETNRQLDRNYLYSIAISQELDKRFLVRRIFIKWQKQTKLFIHYENILQDKYEKLCSGKLSTWRHRVRLNQQAAAWRHVCLLDTFLRKWRLKLEEKEDEEIKSKLLIGDDYANS